MKDTQINLITEEKPPQISLTEKTRKICVEAMMAIFASITVCVILFYHFDTWINRSWRKQDTLTKI